ncbi:MAG: FMN-binding protein [Epulopiscium sp.]|nr:FMN-binding protein [Candidatus Epulonipiscium sp.]HOQ16671.1 FMN-binding protein [Defluviitaleaceae bacterium]HPT76172.1 FMN-binding protein [Defluviitaleaceae bacterium]
MKKIILMCLSLALAVSVLSACNTGKQAEDGGDTTGGTQTEVSYKDGSYKAEADSFDEHGWKPVITIEVKDGKISSVDYDEVNEAGASKETDEEYNKNMKDKVGLGPAEAIPQLEKDLVEKQDVNAVDTVTGATGTTNNFKTMANKALEEAKN